MSSRMDFYGWIIISLQQHNIDVLVWKRFIDFSRWVSDMTIHVHILSTTCYAYIHQHEYTYTHVIMFLCFVCVLCPSSIVLHYKKCIQLYKMWYMVRSTLWEDAYDAMMRWCGMVWYGMMLWCLEDHSFNSYGYVCLDVISIKQHVSTISSIRLS